MNAPLGLRRVKGVALAVTDLERAQRFYAETLGLPVVSEAGEPMGYRLGDAILMLKPDWYASPTDMPNPRVTLEVEFAPDTEASLRELGVTIADPVAVYEEAYYVGSFLDSEGNKLWFCSEMQRVE